jgi:hypothetical protein
VAGRGGGSGRGAPRRRLEPRDIAGLLKAIERQRAEAAGADRAVRRVAVTYEAGRDGFGACAVKPSLIIQAYIRVIHLADRVRSTFASATGGRSWNCHNFTL